MAEGNEFTHGNAHIVPEAMQLVVNTSGYMYTYIYIYIYINVDIDTDADEDTHKVIYVDVNPTSFQVSY